MNVRSIFFVALVLPLLSLGCRAGPFGTFGDSETGTGDTGTDSATGGTGDSEGGGESGDETGTGTTGDPDTGETTGGGAACGDGVLNEGEDCDGAEFNGQSCEDLGFLGGELACSESCTVDATGCVNEICGNGMIEGNEECDGAELGGANCVDLGFGPGIPLCADDCSFDTSTCETPGEGEPCGFNTPCMNNLNCVGGTCYDGSPGDPCGGDNECLSGSCVSEQMWGEGTCD